MGTPHKGQPKAFIGYPLQVHLTHTGHTKGFPLFLLTHTKVLVTHTTKIPSHTLFEWTFPKHVIKWRVFLEKKHQPLRRGQRGSRPKHTTLNYHSRYYIVNAGILWFI